MQVPSRDELATDLSRRLGLRLAASDGHDPTGAWWIDLHPIAVDAADAFRVQIKLRRYGLSAEFVPGTFAEGLANTMSRAEPVRRRRFADVVAECSSGGATIELQIDHKSLDPVDVDTWPSSWSKFALLLKKPFAGSDALDRKETTAVVLEWAERFMAMILALVPPEKLEQQHDPNPEGLPEGARMRVEVNKYERSPINRANCIAIHGDSCSACGFNFGKAYGSLGEGFIHVHHVVPVSQLGHGYVVNPATDLVPLCPNCHAMSHRADPPLTVQQLKTMLNS